MLGRVIVLPRCHNNAAKVQLGISSPQPRKSRSRSLLLGGEDHPKGPKGMYPHKCLKHMSSFSPTSMCKKLRLWEALVARTRWEKWEGSPLNLRDLVGFRSMFFCHLQPKESEHLHQEKLPRKPEKNLSFDGWKLGCSRYKLQSRYDVFLPSSQLIVAPRRNAPTASNKPL